MLSPFETIVSREKVYTDVDFGFRANVITGDISRKKDIEAIRQSVINILTTNRGERPFMPDFGANLSKYLFENFDSITSDRIKEEIRYALANYEPRVKILDIKVTDRSDNNAIQITLEGEIITSENIVTTIDLMIQRQR